MAFTSFMGMSKRLGLFSGAAFSRAWRYKHLAANGKAEPFRTSGGRAALDLKDV